MPDKLGPIEIEFVLDKQADEQAKKLKTSLDAVGTSAKTAIKEQQALIKSMEEDIKRIQNLITSATPIAKNKGIFAELSRMKESLAAEQGKLNELQKTGIDQDAKEEVSKNTIVESLKKWGIGLFTVGAALKVAKDIINSTEGSADKFNETVGLLTGGIQGLYRTIITGQWDQLITNIVNAAKATRDLKKATSELEHITAGGTIKRAELLLKLEEAKTKAWEAMDPKEFTKFYDQAESYQKQITELNVGEIKKRLTIDEDYYFKLTGHSKEYYDFLLTQIPNIAKNYETFFNQQEGYQIRLNQLKYLASAQTGGLTKAQEKERHELQLMVFALEDYKILQEDLSKKGQWDEYIKGIGDMTQAAAAGQLSLVLLAKYKSMAAMKTMTADKAAIEVAKTENQIKIQQELLNKAIESGNAVEIKAISERIRKLQEELVVRQRIAEAAIAATMTREGLIPKITGLKAPILLPGGLKIPNTLAGRPTQDSADYIQGTAMLTEAGKAKQKKKDAKYDKDAEDSLKRQLKLRDEIVRAAADLINQIGQQIGLDEKSMALLNAGLDAFTALATKGAAGIPEAAMAMVLGIIKQIPSEASRFEAQIEHINQLLAEQQRLIDQSEQKGGQAADRENTLSTLEKKAAAQKAEYERLQKSADKHLDLLGWRQKKADEANKAWKDTTNLIEDSNAALADFYTSTTASTIADSIVQGFQDGETSAAGFADKFNGFMTSALDAALKDSLLIDLRPWYEQFKIDMADGLSKEDKAALKAQYDDIIAKGKADRNAMYAAAGIDPTGAASSSANSMTGAIKGVSEETASVLAGQVNNIRISQAESVGIMRQQLMHLAEIAANTRYNRHLESIDKKLDALNNGSLRSQGL